MSAGSDEPLGLEETLALELARVVEPLATAVEEGADGFDELLLEAGLAALLSTQEQRRLRQVLEDVVEPAEVVLEAIDGEGLPDVIDLIEAVDGILGAITALDDLAFQNLDNAGERFLDFLLVRFLDQYHHALHSSLHLFGVIAEVEEGPPTLDFGTLVDVFREPLELPKRTFGWADRIDDFAAFLLLYYLKELFWAIGMPASLDGPETAEIETLADGISLSDLEDLPPGFEYELRVPVISLVDDSGTSVAGFKLVPLPGKALHLPGLALVVFGSFDAEFTERLGDDWSFNVDSTGELGDHGFSIRPRTDGAVDVTHVADVTSPGSGSGADELEAIATLTHHVNDTGGDERVLLGTAGASRIAVRSLSARATLRYRSGDGSGGEFLLEVELPAAGTLGIHPSDFDGFLASVLPAGGIFYDFDVTVGWSSETGLYFERGGTLEVSLPVGERIGPALLEEIYLSIGTPETDPEAQSNASPAAMHIVGAASASIELGPIVGTVKRMGVSADVSFPENADGNLGPIDLDMGFEPPDGIGLVVDAGGVTGGGYLEFDHENERYAGTLQLHIGDLVLSAVGLLTTRLPDGSSGFSLLVIIAGEFTPVQLGLGFTLNGVGGLLGINRSFRAEPLGEAVREGSLDSVLFPVDPVANAQRIISDLRAIFPPTRDVHVFGPMAKLGYGTPAMVTADLAVLLEIPTFKLAVLGRLRARLPDEEAPLVILNMDVVGVLDPPGQRASIDASLFDSRIGAYTVSGDMAMRTSWGENPRFVLSVGGFHPRFDPPADFPALRRVRVGIGEPGGNPSIDLNGYMALTSNTAQVGAGASFRAEAGPAKVEGKFAFDALFEFDPFRFVIDFLVHVSVRVYGKGLSVRVDGTLSGTSPWRVKGRISIDLWLIEVNASIDLTLGEKETHTPLPAARVMPLLAESISNPSNWAAQLPPRGRTSVTLREVKTIPDEVLVHPLGRLSVRQTIVPLEFQIETFRRATPGDFVRFSITGVTIEGTSGALELGESTTEQFAPAQFLNLTDDQKLDTPAFESLEAGRRMSTDGLGAAVSGGSQRALLTYETTVVDREEVVYGRRLRDLGAAGTMLVGQTWAMTEALAETSAVAKAQRQAIGPVRTAPVVDVTSGTERDEPTHRIDARTGALTGQIRLNEETYAIADARTMEPVDPVSMQPITVDTAERNTMPKSEAKRTLSRYEATHPGDAGLYRVVAMHRLRSAAARPA